MGWDWPSEPEREPASPPTERLKPAATPSAAATPPHGDPVAKETSPAAPAPAEPAARAPIEAAVPPGELDLDTIVRAWPLVKDRVKRRKISFHAVLLPAEPVGWRNGELVLEFGPRSRFHRDKVADPAQNGPLLEAFAEVLGVTPRVTCVLGQEPAVSKAPAGPAGPAPDDAGPSEMDGTEPPEDAIELIRRAFKGTVVVEEP